MINLKYLQEKVNRALEKIKIHEQKIIANNISERAITHKLAEYLQIEFPDHNVDCEYNRNYELGQDVPKRLQIMTSLAYKKLMKVNHKNDISIFFEQISPYPDIIIHGRMDNKHNLLVIEVKKNNNKSDWEIDVRKLKGFTSSSNSNIYKYKFGLHITFYVQESWKEPKLVWYKNGKIISANLIENNSIKERR